MNASIFYVFIGIAVLISPIVIIIALFQRGRYPCPNCDTAAYPDYQFCVNCRYDLSQIEDRPTRWGWLRMPLVALALIVVFLIGASITTGDTTLFSDENADFFSTPTQIPTGEIMIVVQDIPYGTRITRDMIALRRVPITVIPIQEQYGLEAIVGKFTLVDLYREQPIFLHQLSDNPVSQQRILDNPSSTLPVGALEYNRPVTGLISHDNWAEEWAFVGRQGETATFIMHEHRFPANRAWWHPFRFEYAGSLRPALLLWAGSQWIEGESYTRGRLTALTVTFPHDDVYTLTATHGGLVNGLNAGVYELRVERGPYQPPPADVMPIITPTALPF